jgi:predicted O-methyltransferase YrrM
MTLSAMRPEIKQLAMQVKGFLSEPEGLRLFELAAVSSVRAACLEIGSYCGKSTLFLAEGCRVAGQHPLFALDHHRGSPEQQPGESHFDPDLLDAEDGSVTTLPEFLRNVRRAGLVDWVVPLIGESGRLSRSWPGGELGMLFIDGGHSEQNAFEDFDGWARRVVPGGYVCIHDVFARSEDGGQAPFHVFEYAQSTGLWEFVDQVESLGIIRRRATARATYLSPTATPTPTPGTASATSVEAMRFLGPFPRRYDQPWTILGHDGGQSIDLGDDHTLFVFSDTLWAASPNPDHQRRVTVSFGPLDKQGVVLSNTAAVATGRHLRQALTDMRYFTDRMGYPREIIEATPDELARSMRFWPEHGLMLDGRVYLYYLGIQNLDTRSSWAFRNLGVGLAVLDPTTGACTRLYRDGDWCFWPAIGDDFHLGVQVLREGEYVYVFVSTRTGLDIEARLARVPTSQIEDPSAYKVLHALPDGWGPDFDGAWSLGPCAPDYSVSYNTYLQQYVLLYVDGFARTLLLRTSDSLVGPYSAPRTVARLPHEPSSEMVYLGFQHPTFSEEGGRVIYFSYCQPRFTSASLGRLTFR